MKIKKSEGATKHMEGFCCYTKTILMRAYIGTTY